MRGSTLLRVLSNGRGTFLAAGGILGVGIYGFIATFEPYNSGRVMHPLPAVEVPHIAASFGPLEIFPAAGAREAVAELAPEPTVLGVAPVLARAVPQPSAPPAPSTPSAVSAAAPPPVPATTPPPLAAAGGGGIEPLSPVASDPPTGMGPVAGEAGESLPRPSVPASPSSPDAPPTVGPAGRPVDGDDDDDDDGSAEPDAPPLDNKGNGKGNAEGRGNGNAANQGKAKGHEK